MTESQKSICEKIILSATFNAETIGSSPIIGTDVVEPIRAVQARMIVELANVFGVTTTDAEAAQEAKTFMDGNRGKMIAGKIVKIILPLGPVACGVAASALTQSLGWEAATRFAMKVEQKIC